MHIEKGLRFSQIAPYGKDTESNATENAPKKQAILTMESRAKSIESTGIITACAMPTMIELKCLLGTRRYRDNLVMSLTENKNRTRDISMMNRESWAELGSDIGSGSAITHMRILYAGSGKAHYKTTGKEVFFSNRMIDGETDLLFSSPDNTTIYQHPFQMISESYHEIRQNISKDIQTVTSNHSNGKTFQNAVLYFPFGGFFRRGAPLKSIEPVYGRLIGRGDLIQIQFMVLSALLKQGISPITPSFYSVDSHSWVAAPPPSAPHYPLSLIEAIDGGKILVTLKSRGDQDKTPVLYQSIGGKFTNPWDGEIAIRFIPKK